MSCINVPTIKLTLFLLLVPTGVVTFERRAMNAFPQWSQSATQIIREFHVDSEEKIEDCPIKGAAMVCVLLLSSFQY
jgi:hypothetical protein